MNHISDVFLLHGAFGTPSQMRPLARALAAQGHRTHPLSLPFRFGRSSIERMAERLAQAVEREAAGRRPVHLVGFSMGAVISRYFIQRLAQPGHVHRFLSLAGPHQGTSAAFLLSTPVTNQLRPNSKLLASLASDPNPWQGVEVAAFYSPWDPIIRPAESARLPGATVERAFYVWPHRALLAHGPAVQEAVRFLSGSIPQSASWPGVPTQVGTPAPRWDVSRP